MPKYLIIWDVGYGQNVEVVDAENEEEARNSAYEAAREEFENNADYSAKLLTPEVAEDYDVELEE